MCTSLFCCLPWCNNDEAGETSELSRTPTPLLEQDLPSPASHTSSTTTGRMRGPPRRTYGKRKTAGSTAAAAVFGGASETSPLLRAQRSSPLSSKSSVRDPLVDITTVVENLSIVDVSEFADTEVLSTVAGGNLSVAEDRSVAESSAVVLSTAAVETLSAGEDRSVADPSKFADTEVLLTAAVENLSVTEDRSIADPSKSAKASKVPQNDPASIDDYESGTATPRTVNTENVPYDLVPLQELLDAYQRDRGYPLQMQSWDEITEGQLSIAKIAEASFAEVYRITTQYGSSILKVMQVKLDSDPSTIDSYTAVEIKSIVAEIRIMNALTEIPGFVSFKDAHLVHGKPGAALADAWKAHSLQVADGDPDDPTQNSYFPSPESFSEKSVFLVLELGDAGEVLQHFRVDTQHKLFDILLGTVVAMSRAEQEAEFEHRDLHENNICVSTREAPENSDDLPESVLFGRSGVEVTLIDYGLSRAKLPTGEVMYYDLEDDLVVFRGEDGKPQYDTYRRMRSHLFTGRHNMFKRNWHTEESRAKNNGHTWAEYVPYTNVLWLKYLFGWLRTQYLRRIALENHTDVWYNIPGVRELTRRFDFRTVQGFDSATDVLIFAIEQGWITNEQIEENGFDSTFISEHSIVHD